MRHMNHLNRPVVLLKCKTLARSLAGRLHHKEWTRRIFMIHVPITRYFGTRAAPGEERHFVCALYLIELIS
jgi:hypothetical protein